MEESFVISSDSTCDLYRDYAREHDIRIVPLSFTMEENGALSEGVDNFAEYEQYVNFSAACVRAAFLARPCSRTTRIARTLNG